MSSRLHTSVNQLGHEENRQSTPMLIQGQTQEVK